MDNVTSKRKPCATCISLKVKCDHNRPCERCRRKGVECTDVVRKPRQKKLKLYLFNHYYYVKSGDIIIYYSLIMDLDRRHKRLFSNTTL